MTALKRGGSGGAVSHIVGRYDAAYTRADGFQSSDVELLNEAGDALGYSIRYNGSAEAGRTGWFYDAETGTLTDLISTIASSNPSFTNYVDFTYLGDDGTVLGEYLTHPGGAIDGTHGMFAWTPSDGLITFENHVAAGLENWDRLSYILEFDGAGYFGQGRTGQDGNSSMAFRLSELAAADLNFDQKVDAQDLAVIVNGFGTSAAGGDVDGNGAVDGHDFLLWQRQLSASPASAAGQVPEPPAAVVALATFVGVCCYVSAVHCSP
jgi:hypothetical protein